MSDLYHRAIQRVNQSTVRTCPVNVKKVQSSATGSIIELNVFYTAVDEPSVMVNTVNVEGSKSTKLMRRR
jgi:hypothetical protein